MTKTSSPVWLEILFGVFLISASVTFVFLAMLIRKEMKHHD